MSRRNFVSASTFSIIAAIKAGNLYDVLKFLVSNDVTNSDKFVSYHEDSNSALHWAVRKANLEIFNLLIKHLRYTDKFAEIIESKNALGETALQLACAMSADSFNLNFVKALLHDAAADLSGVIQVVIERYKAANAALGEEKLSDSVRLSKTDAQQLINLIFLQAVKQGDKDQANALYQAGAQIECTDEDSNNALMLAAQFGRKDVLEWLYDTINIGGRVEENSAEGEAIVQHVAQGETAAENRLNELLGQRNQFGFGISAIAKIHGHYPMVEEIFGIQLFAGIVEPQTLIIEAARAGNKTVVENFLTRNPRLINSFFADDEGLVLAAAAGGDVEMLKFLVDNIGPISLYGEVTHERLINYKIAKEKLSIAEITRRGIVRPIVHFRNNDYENPVLLAAKFGHLPMLKYLVDQKNRPLFVYDRKRFAPIHKAAAAGQFHIAQWLVNEKRQDLSEINRYTRMGGFFYDEEGWRPMDNEAAPSEEYNWTAFDLAVKHGHFDIVLWAVLCVKQELTDQQLKIAIQYNQQRCGQVVIQQLTSQLLAKSKVENLIKVFDNLQVKINKFSAEEKLSEGVQPTEYLLPGIIAGYQDKLVELLLESSDDKNVGLLKQLIAKFYENINVLSNDIIVALLVPVAVPMYSGNVAKVKYYHQVLLKQFETHPQLAELKAAIAEQLLNSQLRARQLAPQEKFKAENVDVNTMARAVATLGFLANNPTPTALQLFKQVSQSLLADGQTVLREQKSFVPQAWQLFQAHYGEEAAATVLESIKSMQGS